ncbi:MAG: hypothetical protein MJ250_06825, partial [Alphaproteobacteria bacterium]|nr:hypothetical protein [Alphaproteobacteria bacterium]
MAEELDQSVVPPSMNNSEYEYVEVPETDAIQYEYVDENGNPIPPEMVNGDNIQYEYVDENGNPIDAENVQYEYVEQEENTPSLETPVADEDALEGYNVSQQAEMTNQQEELTVDMLGDIENSIPEESNAEQETAEVYEYVDENGNPVDPKTLENVEYTYEEVEVPSAEVGNMEESSEIVGVSDLETPVEEVPVPEVATEPGIASEGASISDLETPVEEVPVPEVVAEPEIASEGASISDLETPVEEVPVPEVAAEPEVASESTNISDLETPVEEVPVPEVVAEPEIASE